MPVLKCCHHGRGIGVKLSSPPPLILSSKQAESRSARPNPVWLRARIVDLFITGSTCILRPHMQGIPGYYYHNITPLHTAYRPA
jgi:hypothetical protein